MNSPEKNLPAFVDLEVRNIELFHELELLGLYAYVRMLIEHETSTVPVIIDRIKQKFGLDERYVLALLQKVNDLGLLMIVKNKED